VSADSGGELSSCFDENDEPNFQGQVVGLIAKDAHRRRQLSVVDYVSRCRTLWRGCSSQVDEVFQCRLLIDTRIPVQEVLPDRKFERTEWPKNISSPRDGWGDWYCCVVGLVDVSSGKFVNEPPGYRLPDEGDSSRRVVLHSLGKPSPEQLCLDSPEPALYAIAFLDILGFSDLLTRGLRETCALYNQLIEAAVAPPAEQGRSMSMIPTEIGYVGRLQWLPVGHAHASDSLLLWTTLYPEYVSPFLDRCSEVYCEALELGVALRGAVVFGEAVLDRPSGTFIGLPIVEAARLEKAQEWTGIVVSPASKDVMARAPIDVHTIFPMSAPVKTGLKSVPSVVLDWPRHWRGQSEVPAVECLLKLRKRGFEKYYDNAAILVSASEQHATWFDEQRSQACSPSVAAKTPGATHNS
jgi:hypothetical protein